MIDSTYISYIFIERAGRFLFRIFLPLLRHIESKGFRLKKRKMMSNQSYTYRNIFVSDNFFRKFIELVSRFLNLTAGLSSFTNISLATFF